ncbi:hypothetical protein B5M42_023160 [Paenibacillus athensensis]|uniref:FCP1 homology domain-containing protein n=1 Tax=Paenibacillus athensensis TaxID=1967502 RepID=A0A4Y8PV28_9BACL|nr:HAD domain-containing protein [Paenibacillus athensensis]MCD1261705.1 hypothetical protein [Paenibacillus athensensis]
MRIIFLDIDGVLNTDRAVRLQRLHGGENGLFDTQAIRYLRELVEESGAQIVLSSTWRIHWGTDSRLWNTLTQQFRQAGIDDRLLGATPVFSEGLQTAVRWKEIEAWLNLNADLTLESFVIIDDEWEMGPFTKDRFVRCRGYNGITQELKAEALRILQTSWRNI